MNRPIEFGELCGPGPFVPEAPRVPPPVWRSGPALEILLWIITLALLFSGLGRAELAAGPEAATALAAREMMRELRLRPIPEDLRAAGAAPISSHLAFLSAWIFERTGLSGPEFAARLPSILFGLLTIGCARGIARRAGGIRARRFAHFALIFMPGWLGLAREAGADTFAAAMLLIGLAMTIEGTTHLASGAPEAGESGGPPPGVAPPLAWFGAGCLWGLAAFAQGPAALLILIPALAAAALLKHEKGSRWARATILGIGAAILPMILIQTTGAALFPMAGAPPPDAASLADQILNQFRAGIEEASHPAPVAAPVLEFARAFPVLIVLALVCAALVLFFRRARRAPDLFLWAALCLALAAIAPKFAPWAKAGIYPAAAVVIGVGLSSALGSLFAAERFRLGAAAALLVVAAGGAEFVRHYRPVPARAPAYRAFALGLAKFLGPNETVGALDLPAEAFEFYLNPLGAPKRDVRVIKEDEWTAMTSGSDPEGLKAIRFVLVPHAMQITAGSPAAARWRSIGANDDLALLERIAPAPAP